MDVNGRAGVRLLWLDVTDGWTGARGDGSTDDTAAIQAVLDVAVEGATIFFPQPVSYYRITDELTVPVGCTLMGTGTPPEIRQVTDDKAIFRVEASRVTICGLKLVGPQSTEWNDAERAVSVVGAAASTPYSEIIVRGNIIERWGAYGVFLQHVTDFVVSDNVIADIVYGGVMALSVIRGRVSGNRIDNLHPTAGNAYGIALTRTEHDSLVTHPRSADVIVSENIVTNIPEWHGIDTHGGQRLIIRGNIIRNCLRGISAGCADNGSQVETFAPLDIIIAENVIDSAVTNGSAYNGIGLTGAAGTLGSPVQHATGVISGNVVRGHGFQEHSTSGAILINNTRGVTVIGNSVVDPSPTGIIPIDDCVGTTIVGNAIVDPWSNDVAATAGIWFRSGYNTGTIAGNTLSRGSKSATHLAQYGARVDVLAGQRASIGANDFFTAVEEGVLSTVGVMQSAHAEGFADRGDSSPTLTWGTDAEIQRFATTLSAARTIGFTAGVAGVNVGARFRIIRTAGGSTLTVNLTGGGTKAMPASTWLDVVWNGAAWIVGAYGNL